jgi:porin
MQLLTSTTLLAFISCATMATAQTPNSAPVVISKNPDSLLEPATLVETRSHTADHPQAEEKNKAISLQIVYTADVWSNAKGGIKTGTRYLDNLDVMLNADLDAAIGLPNTSLFVYGLYNNGNSFTGDLAGDAQGISNIETGTRAAKLYEAWAQYDFSDKASVRVGLYDLNSEFDTLESAGLFMGSAHGIGTDIAQSGENGPSIFPSTSLAARIDYKPSDKITLRAAVLDGVPGDPANPKRTAIKLGGGDGALIVAEAVYDNGMSKVIGGYWRFTAAFENRLASSLPTSQVFQRGNDGFYLRGEHWFFKDEADRGLRGFARLGFADGKFNDFSRFYGAGLVYTGPFKIRPEDQLGLAVAVVDASNDFRTLALAGGGITDREVALELTYRAQLAKYLTVQPNIQYVINPGLDPNLSDVLAFGLRAELGWTF